MFELEVLNDLSGIGQDERIVLRQKAMGIAGEDVVDRKGRLKVLDVIGRLNRPLGEAVETGQGRQSSAQPPRSLCKMRSLQGTRLAEIWQCATELLTQPETCLTLERRSPIGIAVDLAAFLLPAAPGACGSLREDAKVSPWRSAG